MALVICQVLYREISIYTRKFNKPAAQLLTMFESYVGKLCLLHSHDVFLRWFKVAEIWSRNGYLKICSEPNDVFFAIFFCIAA